MDYGDRQQRAEMLVKMFRMDGDQTTTINGRTYTRAEIADEIENMTDFGRTVLAAAGLVIQALKTTPKFFVKQTGLA